MTRTVIAESLHYKIVRYDSRPDSVFIIGLDVVPIGLTPNRWDELAKAVAYADIKIRGNIQ